jgi:hypothetical protein
MTDKRDFGPKPKLTWLPVKRLTVDMRYQRTLESTRSQKLIDRMVAEFRWQRFGAVLAAPAAMGNYALIDGQHRVEVLKRLGEPEAPAILLESISLAEQAAAFLAANRDRVTVNPFAIHHAAVQSGDPVAVQIDAMCRAADVSVPRYPIPIKNMKPDQTMALGALKKMVGPGAPEGLGVRVLKALRRAFPDDPDALRAHFIIGVRAFAARNPGVDEGALADGLARAGLNRLQSVMGYGGLLARAEGITDLVGKVMRRQPGAVTPAKLPDDLAAIRARLEAEEAAKPKARAKPAPLPAAKPAAPGRDITSALMGDPVRR